MGVDLHGADDTKAAGRAASNAIQDCSDGNIAAVLFYQFGKLGAGPSAGRAAGFPEPSRNWEIIPKKKSDLVELTTSGSSV
ncbi:MAG: hypothetical protein CMQ19_14185 [Gammaproteobacteria bacterium]|jgi:hypothetical protein|nr:hypothetical protein [Gammaproteobacteria bacterium]